MVKKIFTIKHLFFVYLQSMIYCIFYCRHWMLERILTYSCPQSQLKWRGIKNSTTSTSHWIISYDWLVLLPLLHKLLHNVGYQGIETLTSKHNIWLTTETHLSHCVVAVGNMSGNRCESVCRSRGREFNPGTVPYFRRDWSWNNFYDHSPLVHWIIQEGLLSVTSESMCMKYWLTTCSSLPRKSVLR